MKKSYIRNAIVATVIVLGLNTILGFDIESKYVLILSFTGVLFNYKNINKEDVLGSMVKMISFPVALLILNQASLELLVGNMYLHLAGIIQTLLNMKFNSDNALS